MVSGVSVHQKFRNQLFQVALDELLDYYEYPSFNSLKPRFRDVCKNVRKEINFSILFGDQYPVDLIFVWYFEVYIRSSGLIQLVTDRSKVFHIAMFGRILDEHMVHSVWQLWTSVGIFGYVLTWLSHGTDSPRGFVVGPTIVESLFAATPGTEECWVNPRGVSKLFHRSWEIPGVV